LPIPGNICGTPEQVGHSFRDALTILDRRISLFVSLPISSLDALAIKREIDRIGLQ
jgi:arsenate reductase